MQLMIILGLIISLIVAVFAVQNAVAVMIHFFIWEFEVSLVYVILGSVVIGALAVALLGAVQQIRLRGKVREQGKQINVLEADIAKADAELTALRQFGRESRSKINANENTGEMEPIVIKKPN